MDCMKVFFVLYNMVFKFSDASCSSNNSCSPSSWQSWSSSPQCRSCIASWIISMSSFNLVVKVHVVHRRRLGHILLVPVQTNVFRLKLHFVILNDINLLISKSVGPKALPSRKLKYFSRSVTLCSFTFLPDCPWLLGATFLGNTHTLPVSNIWKHLKMEDRKTILSFWEGPFSGANC